MREAIRHFLADDKPGSIVNVSSVHQLIPKPGYLGYSASKGGMQNITRTLALEYAGRGIRVNGVAPGATVTPINRAWIDDPEKRQVEEHIPMQRAGDGRDGGRDRVPRLRRRGLHHRADDLRRRRAHALPELPHAMVVGMTSRFGAEDQLGMLNHVDEAKRLEALALVREGRMFDLGHVLDEHIPVFPGRYFRQTLVTTAHHANGNGGVGEGHVNWITEQVAGTMQIGTHLDALSHLQMEDRVQRLDGRGTGGDNRSHAARRRDVPQIVTHGWLVDASQAGHVIEIADLGSIDPSPGDAVLFHTGWGAYWDDPDRYLSEEPGPGCAVAGWLAERGVALTGCDTWSYGPVPPENPQRPFEVPQILNVEHGVFIVENLDTRARGRRRARVLPRPDPSQAPRRHRRVDVPDRPRLGGLVNGL